MLVSTFMIAQAINNSWSELLTIRLVVEAKLIDIHTGFLPDVSNPAQNRKPWPVMINSLKDETWRFSDLSGLSPE